MEESRPTPLSPRELDALAQARVIYLATVRKDGTQSRAAPMWFTVTPPGEILIQSGPQSWHSRRIRRGSPVIVWIGRQRRIAFIGKAEPTDDPLMVAQIISDYPKKYWMARFGWHRPGQASFEKRERLAIKIIAIERLPVGFSSQPGALVPSIAGRPSNPG
jgi:hypothetical protein